METRIRDDVFPSLRNKSYKGHLQERKKRRVILRRVTGGAKGLGEHIRSFTTDEQYTPKARTISNLIVKIQRTVNQRVRWHEFEPVF